MIFLNRLNCKNVFLFIKTCRLESFVFCPDKVGFKGQWPEEGATLGCFTELLLDWNAAAWQEMSHSLKGSFSWPWVPPLISIIPERKHFPWNNAIKSRSGWSNSCAAMLTASCIWQNNILSKMPQVHSFLFRNGYNKSIVS